MTSVRGQGSGIRVAFHSILYESLLFRLETGLDLGVGIASLRGPIALVAFTRLAIGVPNLHFFTTARNQPMNRLFALLLAAAMVWGCRAPTPTFDPFQGAPRIPPPGTGQVGQALPGDAYYSTQPGAAAAAPARYVPRDGSYQFRSGAVERAGAAAREEVADRGQRPAAREEVGGIRGQGSGAREASLASEQPSGVSTAGFEQDVTDRGPVQGNVRQAANWEQERSGKPARYDARIRVVEPAEKAEEGPPADKLREPSRFEPAGPVTEISDLPKDRVAAPAGAKRGTTRAASDGPTRSASASDTAAPVPPTRFATNTRSAADTPSGNRPLYGYDPQYRSLQGRLEYSESEHRWKLRYIPIDGQTDKYGGSVVLPDSPQLNGFEPGDFAAVKGIVGKKDPRSRGFAPDYQLQQITRAE